MVDVDNGAVQVVTVLREKTVYELQASVAVAFRIHIEDTQLTFNGMELDNEWNTLIAYGIVNASIVQLSRPKTKKKKKEKYDDCCVVL